MAQTAIQPAFVRFSEEAAIVGRLLGGYAVLELDLLNCVAMGTKDFDVALKQMFGARGETKRISRAEKLGRPPYAAQGLEGDFDAAIDAMRHCLMMRNQYAHYHFYDDLSGKLALVNLEEQAKLPHRVADLKSLTTFYVDVPILRAQEEYWHLTDRLIIWLNYERRLLAKELNVRPAGGKPTLTAKPALHL